MHGIGSLALTSIALLTIGHFVRPIDAHPRHRRNILLLADRTDVAAQTPRDLQRLRALLEDLPVDATVYDAGETWSSPPIPTHRCRSTPSAAPLSSATRAFRCRWSAVTRAP